MAKEKKDLSKYLKAAGGDGSFLNNADTKVDRWVDTGSYVLNALCSASLHRGVPVDGRIIMFYGPSGSGKTLFLAKIFGNAQKQYGITPIVYDSENAFDERIAKSCGMDVDNSIHEPFGTVEEVRNKIYKLLNTIIENGDIGKFIIGVDSISVSCQKEVEDAVSGKTASDMGAKAKSITSFFRLLTPLAAKAKTSIIITNKVVENPAALFKSNYMIVSGGSASIYMSSIAVQLRTTKEKFEVKKGGDDDDNSSSDNSHIGVSKGVSGIKITALTTKNRFIPQDLEGEIYLNYQTGLNRYGGLFEFALAMNVITLNGKKYSWSDDINNPIGAKKNLISDKKFWDELIKRLEVVIQDKLKYSEVISNEVDELIKEVETEEVE